MQISCYAQANTMTGASSMGTIVVVASTKGGCAKTTTAMALATNLVALRYSVAVNDADPNQAFRRWYEKRKNPPMTVTSEIDQNSVISHLRELAKAHDTVVCDTGGFQNQTQMFAIGAATFVIIPVMPDQNSVAEARRTAKQIMSVSQIRERTIPYGLLLTRWHKDRIAERATLEEIQDLADPDRKDPIALPILQQVIGDLSAFQKATYTGDMPTTGIVGHIISKLIDELVDLGAIPPHQNRKVAA
jgi:chromosome partitioning protein